MLSNIWNKILSIFGGSNEESKSGHHHHHHRREHHHLTEIQKQARRQIEFYFSPPNFQRDSYMKQLVDHRDDRYCEISEFVEKFNKIKELGISVEELAEALSTSHKLEVDETKTLVRTIDPIENDPRINYKTICIEGIDKQETEANLKNLLTEQFGKIVYLKMRTYQDKRSRSKKFSGKIDVQLLSEEKAEEAHEKGFEYNGEVLPVRIFAKLLDNEDEKGNNSIKRSPRSAKPKASE